MAQGQVRIWNHHIMVKSRQLHISNPWWTYDAHWFVRWFVRDRYEYKPMCIYNDSYLPQLLDLHQFQHDLKLCTCTHQHHQWTISIVSNQLMFHYIFVLLLSVDHLCTIWLKGYHCHCLVQYNTVLLIDQHTASKKVDFRPKFFSKKFPKISGKYFSGTHLSFRNLDDNRRCKNR